MRSIVIQYIVYISILILSVAKSNCQVTTTTSLGIVNDNVVAFLGDLVISDQDGGMNTMSYTIFIDGIVSIEEVVDENVKIYPNPTSSKLSILSERLISEYQILDINGQIIQKGSADKQIDVDHLTQGHYILRLNDMTTLYFQKL